MKKALKSDADFIIFDRYAYDELANLTLSSPIARLYVRLIMKIVPRPHISYCWMQIRFRPVRESLNILSNFSILCRASYITLNEIDRWDDDYPSDAG